MQIKVMMHVSKKMETIVSSNKEKLVELHILYTEHIDDNTFLS